MEASCSLPHALAKHAWSEVLADFALSHMAAGFGCGLSGSRNHILHDVHVPKLAQESLHFCRNCYMHINLVSIAEAVEHVCMRASEPLTVGVHEVRPVTYHATLHESTSERRQLFRAAHD